MDYGRQPTARTREKLMRQIAVILAVGFAAFWPLRVADSDECDDALLEIANLRVEHLCDLKTLQGRLFEIEIADAGGKLAGQIRSLESSIRALNARIEDLEIRHLYLQNEH